MIFWHYIHKNRKVFTLFSVFVLFFITVFWLSHVPIDSVLYGTLLCLYTGFVLTMVDFLRFKKRYKLLTQLKKSITVQLGVMPPPRDAMEVQYQELLRALDQHKTALIVQSDKKQRDTSDYFTLWTHQIKTPIAAMSLLLQSQHNQQEFTYELESELTKIEQYVEFVLQFLRLEHMSNDLVLKKYELADIVKQALRRNAKQFIRKKIRLDYSDFQCVVLTDQKWLLFVIEQILSNALKYTREGSISIFLQEKRLVIQDTGIGILADDLPRVYEKGFTGYNGRALKQSTGIGLYLCKQILDKLSHNIAIESEVGKGTKVIIDLATRQIGVE